MVNQYQRAAVAWPVLTETAARTSKITYVQLAQHLGIHPRPIRYVLGVIQDHCMDEKLPPLTILVVNQRGTPGEGFIAWDIDDLDEGYRRVWAYPWYQLANPFAFAAGGDTPDELARHLVRKPQESAAIYGRINNRGVAQDVFRRALLLAYRQRCAFCGLSLKEALQAAHIIPWREATISQRLDPANGLLLCGTHHLLFDADVLTVSADRRIVCRLVDNPGHGWTDSDRQSAIALGGRPLSIPVEEPLQPSIAALQHRADSLAR
jgi:putative restriction endonuclease